MMSRTQNMLAPTHKRTLLPPTEMLPAEKHYRPRGVRGPLQSVAMMGGLWILWSLGFPMWIILGAFVFHVVALGHRGRAGAIAQNQVGIDLLNQGQIRAASEQFEQLSKTERGRAGHAVYVFNRAVAFMLEGKLRRAMSLFNAVHHSRAFRFGPNRAYEAYLYAEMAACYGLLNITPEAYEFRERAKHYLKPQDVHRLAFADAIFALRDGRLSDAARIIDSHGPSARDLLRPPSFRALLVLRLFTLHLQGDSGSQDYQHLRRVVAPKVSGEYDYLGVAWPELRAFLVSEQISGTRYAN